MKRRSGFILCLLLLMNLYCNAQEADSILLEEYWNMSLEELANVQISIASKKEESRFESPFSTYIITQEDMQ